MYITATAGLMQSVEKGSHCRGFSEVRTTLVHNRIPSHVDKVHCPNRKVESDKRSLGGKIPDPRFTLVEVLWRYYR